MVPGMPPCVFLSLPCQDVDQQTAAGPAHQASVISITIPRCGAQPAAMVRRCIPHSTASKQQRNAAHAFAYSCTATALTPYQHPMPRHPIYRRPQRSCIKHASHRLISSFPQSPSFPAPCPFWPPCSLNTFPLNTSSTILRS